MRMDRRTFSVTLLAGVATSLLAHASEAQVGSRARNVVLVHGGLRGRLKLVRGHPPLGTRWPERHGGAESADLARRRRPG
jgi:hypothetical protein